MKELCVCSVGREKV